MSPGPRYLPEWLDYTQEPREIHGSTFVFCDSQPCQERVGILKALAVLPLDVPGSPVGPEI